MSKLACLWFCLTIASAILVASSVHHYWVYPVVSTLVASATWAFPEKERNNVQD